jgi:sugar diacid utilization regulator
MKIHKMLETINRSRVPVYFKKFEPDEMNDEVQEVVKDTYIIKPQRRIEVKASRVWANICINNKPVGHLVVLEYCKPFQETDFELINIISQALSIQIQNESYSNKERTAVYEWFVSDLLDGKITDKGVVEEKLEYMGLDLKNDLYLLVIMPNSNQTVNIPEQYVKRHLEAMLGGKAVTYKDYLIIILSRQGDNPLDEDSEKSLKDFLNEHGLLGALSRRFTHFLHLRKHFKQAVKALELGSRLNSHETLFFYENYVLQHLLDMQTVNENIKDFCHPAIFKLMEHDRENNTCYMQSLYSYIYNFRKMGELANTLHVHRNTLNYRIRKMEEIMNVSLYDTDQLFRLYLSFKILEFSGYRLFKPLV